MPEDNSIFGKPEDQPTTTDDGANRDQGEPKEGNKEQLPEELQNLVGEDKKYKSVEDALKSIPHSQQHISQLEQELAEMRERLESARTVDDILDQINQPKQEEHKEPERKQESPQLSQDDIARIVDSRISEQERMQTAHQNQQAVVERMQELYGDKAEETYVHRAEELGVPVEWLNETASKSPQAVFELFGLNKKERATPKKTSEGSYNSDSFKGQSRPERKPVMTGASTSELVDAWRRSRPEVGG